jgi:hypothetical protein
MTLFPDGCVHGIRPDGCGRLVLFGQKRVAVLSQASVAAAADSSAGVGSAGAGAGASAAGGAAAGGSGVHSVPATLASTGGREARWRVTCQLPLQPEWVWDVSPWCDDGGVLNVAVGLSRNSVHLWRCVEQLA